jgi:SAM-dependent methyltransferase
MKTTGERASTSAGGFNPTYQRHVAAYALCAPFLPQGRIVDVGCGTGHSFELLSPRETVGVDLDARALAGQPRETHVADMRALPFADDVFAGAIAVQSIEHVPDGGRAVGEMARVVKPGGVVVLVTPNRLTFGRPDEVIDPYHHVEYDACELAELCTPHFASVEIRGLFGSERYLAVAAADRRRLERLLALDPIRVRSVVPRRLRQRLYDVALRRARASAEPRAAAIEPGDFRLAPGDLDCALDLVAVCRG